MLLYDLYLIYTLILHGLVWHSSQEVQAVKQSSVAEAIIYISVTNLVRYSFVLDFCTLKAILSLRVELCSDAFEFVWLKGGFC